MIRRERNEVGRQAKNFPLQGACADGPQLALAPLWKRRDECPGALPVPAVHNEIFVEVEEDEAQQVQAWLKEVMVEEWRGGSTIPCLEVRACQWRSRRGFAKYGLDGQAGD